MHRLGHIQFIAAHWRAHQRSIGGSKFEHQLAPLIEVPGLREGEHSFKRRTSIHVCRQQALWTLRNDVRATRPELAFNVVVVLIVFF